MQQLAQIKKEELDQFNKLRHSQNGLDENTFHMAFEYFRLYRSKFAYTSGQKLIVELKSALFIAEKSQKIETVNGQRILQPSMTLGQLLKQHDPETIMVTLKNYSKQVTIGDEVASIDVKALISEISLMLKIHGKFAKCILNLELKERYPQTSGGQYIKNLSSFAWLLYIQFKHKYFAQCPRDQRQQLIQNTCMLAHSLAFMVTCAWQYLVPRAILKPQNKINEHSSIQEVGKVIRDKITEAMILSKNSKEYGIIATALENYFYDNLVDNKTKTRIIKMSRDKNDFLSPEYLQSNYKRLDKFYQKSIESNDLDERIFLKERIANLTPSKFTPFARQGHANKNRKSTQNDNYHSHRILNYEMMDKLETTMKNNNNEVTISNIKLPRGVLMSPSTTMKVNLIQQTPFSAAMGMCNYLEEIAKKGKQMIRGKERPFEKAIFRDIQKFLQVDRQIFDKKIKQIREQNTFSLFKFALEDYLTQNPKEEQNESIYKALMAVSLELVLWVNNSKVLTFEEIEAEVNVSAFSMWKACDFFAKIDRNMPINLRTHIVDLESNYLNYKLWNDFDNLKMISKVSNNQALEKQSEQADRLFRKLLVNTAYQITNLTSQFGVEQKIEDHIFSTMKNIFTEHTKMVQNMHVDQLIMCTFFAFNKAEKLDISFRQIIERYKAKNEYNQEIHEDIVNKIQLEGREDPINLIMFYNEVFIKAVKDCILNLKNSSGGNHENKKNGQNPLLFSPLKQVISNVNRKGASKSDKNSHNLLLAHTESPLLKQEPRVIRGLNNPKSRKIINFDEEEKKDFKEEKVERQYEKLSPKAMGQGPSHTYHEYSKKAPSNMPWKTPQQPQTINVNGLTPTRINKTVSTHQNSNNLELNQFNLHPQPHSQRIASQLNHHQQHSQNTQLNQNRINFGSKGTRMHYQ